MEDYTQEEQITIWQNMYTFGGSFIKALSECYRKADLDNKKKLVAAFPEEFERYLKM